MAITGKNDLIHWRYLPPCLSYSSNLRTGAGISAGSQPLRRLMCPPHSSWGHFFPRSFRGQLIQKRQSPIELWVVVTADTWTAADHPLPRRGQRPAAQWAQLFHCGEHWSRALAAPQHPAGPPSPRPPCPAPSLSSSHLLTRFSFHLFPHLSPAPPLPDHNESTGYVFLCS